MYLGVSCGQVTVSWAVPLLFKVKEMLVEHVSLPTVIKTLTELSYNLHTGQLSQQARTCTVGA